MPTTQSALRAGRAKTGTGVPVPLQIFLDERAACDLQMPPYDMTEFARQPRRDHAPLSFGRVLLAQAVRLPAAGRLKPALYNTAYLYPIGLLHSTANAIFPGLLIGVADIRTGDG